MDPNLTILLQLLVAAVLGGIIGYERERAGHYAGIRTHTLVCLTSAFLVSILATHFEPDSVARVIAALMTGIGFIGAGTILSHGREVKGLTTAASVWGAAGLGIVIGMGELIISSAITLLIVAVLEMRFFSLKRKRVF
ncbi:MgtC/SapB family protein [Candidatus Woesearchaeota archaeon]|nr:MgtC/SapB family protein [Candidatus Woesearchaeota archaeon]